MAEFSLTPNLEYFTSKFCLWLQLFAKSQQKSMAKLQLFLEDSIFTPYFQNASEHSGWLPTLKFVMGKIILFYYNDYSDFIPFSIFSIWTNFKQQSAWKLSMR